MLQTGLDTVSSEASRQVRGVESKLPQRYLSKVALNPSKDVGKEGQNSLAQGIKALSKSNQFKNAIKQHSDFIQHLLSGDKQDLKNYVLDSLEDKNDAEFGIFHRRLEHAVDQINTAHSAENDEKIRQAMAENKQLKNQHQAQEFLAAKKQLHKIFKFKPLHSAVDRKNEFKRAENFIKAHDITALLDQPDNLEKALETLAHNPNKFAEMLKDDPKMVNLVEAVMKPFARNLQDVSANRLSNYLGDYLNKQTLGGITATEKNASTLEKKQAFHQFAKILNDKTDLVDNLKRSFYPVYDPTVNPKTLSEKLTAKYDKNPKAQAEFLDYLHTNAARG